MTESVPATVRLAEPRSSTLFDLLGEIGSGGMGTIYRARAHANGEIVAVKLLKNEGDTVRFALEINALARLEHPNIVRYLGHGVTDGGAQFLVMEWLEGENLAELLLKGALPTRRVLEIARDVAAALAHAHDAGIVHRDLKPSNIFVSNGRVKVLDFGVARILGETGLTHTGQVIGTPSYMSPEQARGDKGIGPPADLFSLGCVIYRCFRKESPFAGPDVIAVLARLATTEAPRLRGVPRAVADLVARLLAKEPVERPGSAKDVVRELDEILSSDLRVDTAAHALATTDSDALADTVTQDLAKIARHPSPRVVERTLLSPSASSAPSRAVPKRAWMGLAIAALALVLGGGGWLAIGHRPHPSTTASAEAHANVRAAAELACEKWAIALARRQKADGSFTGEEHRVSTGWDTAQEVAALESARACSTVSPTAIQSGLDAVLHLHHASGWSGPGAVGDESSVPADAWATLALTLASDDPRLLEQALIGRKLLLSLERPDGSFASTKRDGPPEIYATLLAAWALEASESIDPDPSTRASRASTFAWLRKSFQASSELRSVAGLEEQFVWVLLEARRSSPPERDSDDVLRAAAVDMVARCALDRATHACTRAVYDDDAATLGDGKIVTLWFAWVGVAARELAASDVTLPPDVRRDLVDISVWAGSTAESSVDGLAALPPYKLAEYLIATSALATSR